MAAHTKIDLYQMQSLPLDAKIRMTARRIDAFIDRNDAYLSISGGKDSRVLDDIERRFVRAKLPRVFIDTGLEHRSVRACGKKHADIILRPEKNFKQIITEYGYPVISKEVAQTIAEARKGLKNGNCYTYRMAKLNGTAVDKNGDKSKYNIPQYKFLLDAPFRISHKCCDYMKKKPAKQYEKETGRLPIVATMAEESNLRLQKWLKHGCNAFDLKRPMSAPMSFWSENDVLEYLFKYELDYAECYGKIIPKLDKEQIEGQITIYEATNDYRGCQFCTTGCKRTGCIFCLFGILQDKDRIIKLEKEDKRLADYVLNGGEYDNEGMWIPTNKGLGYIKILDFLKENGLDIVPRSVWTLGHRPKCSPEGMVYLGGGTWVDIYLNSDDGAKGLKSEYGCAPMTGTESMNWYNFVERLAKSGKNNVIRQIKRCLFRQIKTGLSEHLTMG